MRSFLLSPLQSLHLFRPSSWQYPISIRSSLLCHKQLYSRWSISTSKSTLSTNESPPRVLYEPIENVERLEHYRPGGYHPVQIGDRYHSRYEIVHKLGHGSYSTIWLAYDMRSKRYVAVKICTANSNPREIDVLCTLTRAQHHSAQSPDRAMIPSISDTFSIEGPNGRHACYITSPARCSLSDTKDGSWTRLFQLDVARTLAAQLVIATEHIHSHGFVHGDLHLGNILLQFPSNFHQLSIEQLYEKYGAPALEPVVHLDGKPLPSGVPSHGVIPIWLGEASDKISLPEAKILLTDFGEAFSPSYELKYESHTPLMIRPPETRFEPTKPLSFESDVWTLACSIRSIIAQRPLFEGFMATQDDITCEQVDALGILPPEWWVKWEARYDRFTEDCQPKKRNPFRSWGGRFQDTVQQPRVEIGMPPIEPTERDAIFTMLRSMLSFRPANRPTAKQILESEWMVKWALPEFYNSQGSA